MKKIIILIFLTIVMTAGFGQGVFAYQIQDLLEVEVKGDIVLGPTKVELFLNPGEKATREIMITNRTGNTVSFSLDIEDFMGSQDVNQPVVFLGEGTSPYSLKNLLSPEIKDFSLKHGQRIYIPIEVSIPKDADPGGRYGVVFASVKPNISSTTEANAGQVAIVARAGVLFFVRVNGETKESGQLDKISTAKKYYEAGPISFNLLYENNGSVHLTPYGTVEIKNILGRTISTIEVDPWFVMPGSLRTREIKWDSGFLFGKYTAVASINRGYQDTLDQKTVTFWVIPWKIVVSGIIALFLAIWFFRWIFSKFEFKRKD
jgi:hypothetical protein